MFIFLFILFLYHIRYLILVWFFLHVVKENNEEPKEKNQRMMELWRLAQQVPTFVVTWSMLVHSQQHLGGGEGVMEGWGGSGDVKFDLWEDDMAEHQRVEAG